jgi:hypothetical protein
VTSFPTGDLFGQLGTCTEQPLAPQITSAAFSGRKNNGTESGSDRVTGVPGQRRTWRYSAAVSGRRQALTSIASSGTGYVASASDSQIDLRRKAKKLGLVTGNNTIRIIDVQGRASNEFTLMF